MKKLLLIACAIQSTGLFAYSWQIHNDTDEKITISVNVSGSLHLKDIPARDVVTLALSFPHSGKCLTSISIKNQYGELENLPWDKQTAYVKEGLLGSAAFGLIGGIVTGARVLWKLCGDYSISIYRDKHDGDKLKWGIIKELVDVELPGSEEEEDKPKKKKDAGTPPPSMKQSPSTNIPPQPTQPNPNSNASNQQLPEYHSR